jgi:hypothetical protein
MFPLIVTFIAAVLACATATLVAAQGVPTYLATVAEVNDCPEGQIRVQMPYERSPFYNPDIVFKAPPAPVSACAELQGVSVTALEGRLVRLIYVDGKFVTVPSVRAH